jgi:hypothetical protein
MAKDNLETPLSPYEREQARLRREADERQKEEEARAAQIKTARGQEIEKKAEIQGIEDPKTREAIVDESAKILAARGARPEQLDWGNHRGVIEEAVDKVLKAEALSRQQEHEKAAALTAQQDAEREKQREAAHEAAIREPIPGAIERFDGVLAASQAQAQQQRDAEAASRSHPDSGTPLWKAQAGTLDRQRRQFGRYDFPPNNPPGGGASAPVPPSPEPPTPPTPPKPPTPARADSPLTANEILARHNNPELEALFQSEQQRRADREKSAPTDATASGNAPPEKARDALIEMFGTAAIKKKVAEDDATRAANPSQSFGRGGGRGRG